MSGLLEHADRLRKEADEIRAAHLKRVRDGTCEALAGLCFRALVHGSG
jgi:hypothetical protein